MLTYRSVLFHFEFAGFAQEPSVTQAIQDYTTTVRNLRVLFGRRIIISSKRITPLD